MSELAIGMRVKITLPSPIAGFSHVGVGTIYGYCRGREHPWHVLPDGYWCESGIACGEDELEPIEAQGDGHEVVSVQCL